MSLTLPVVEPTPRYATARRSGRPTRGGLDARVAELLGWDLFAWQRAAVDVAGEHDPVTKIPFYRTVGIAVARQNGKTALVCTRVARQLIAPRQTVGYTAQDRTTARVKWAEHVDLLMSTPFAGRVARVDLTNHREMLVMTNGSRYMPVTPTERKGGRALSIDLAVIDEARAHESMGVVGALAATTIARPHAQVWLLSNAGDDRSLLWSHFTELGRAEVDNPDSTMCWIEYGAEPGADPNDRGAWAAANPSMGERGGVIESALADAALTMDADTFRREHLNVWTNASSSKIDAVTWAGCFDAELEPGDTVAFGLDFKPERDAGTLVVAGRQGDRIALEVVESSADLGHMVTAAAEAANRWQAPIVVAGTGPAASAIPALERATSYTRRGKQHHRVQTVTQSQLARACGGFHDAAVTAQLAHRDDYRLNDAVAAAETRRIGDTWVWQRRGVADISPLVAATLACWGVSTLPAPTPAPVATTHSPAARRLRSVRMPA